jgi:hypothetical protein
MKKLFVIPLVLSLAACLGPNNAFNSLRNWNATVTDQDWLNEIIFLALNIIPVYGIFYLGDIVIFNTMDYWSGDNPIGDPGPFPDTFSNK